MNLVLANIARVARTFAMAIWVGGLIFFVVVAAVAFGNLPNTHEAGIVVRNCLIAIHKIGMVAGFLYFAFTFMLSATVRWTNPRQGLAEIALVGIMLLLTTYSQNSIIPTMERDRIALFQQYGAEVDATPKSAPAHVEFDHLHNVSTKVEGTVLLLGLIVLALGSIETKPRPA
jgi:hypothetical protein